MPKAIWWFLSMACLSLWAQSGGSVKGVVVDETGKPLAGAEVHIAEKKSFVGHRLIQIYETNNDGRFLIDNVSWGTYVVMVGKEDAGYPDTKLAFYSNLAAPTVILAPESPSADVIVKIGPKAGVLDLDPVTDVVTGKKIDSATITLRRTQNPDLFLTTSAAGGRLLVPSRTDVTIEIAAPTYKPWPLDGEKSEGQMRLLPQEVRKLQVRLHPDLAKPD
jgi:hypothetical protein